jgi:2-methylisocitrate lyase-like PEP mutase family enzyme
MSKEEQNRRGFIKNAGLAASSVLGSTILSESLDAQRGQGRGQGAVAAGSGSMSKGARLRAALATGEPLIMPVVQSIMLTRLCEIEGFKAGFIGGSGEAARNALPNNSIQTIQEVIDYERQIMEETDLPICADGENGGGSPVTVYRTVQQLERAGAAMILIEDSTGPESEYGSKGVTMASQDVMVNRIKAAVDGRKDQNLMILMRSDRPSKGHSEQETLDVCAACSAAGADAFFISGFTLDQQQKAKSVLKKPLMVGSGGPAEDWHSKGVDMAFYHIDTIGIGAMYMALKEIKATGKFTEAAKIILPREINARLIEEAGWLARAKKYGVV